MNAVSPNAYRWSLRRSAVLVYACALQGWRPLYSPDEGRYTNVALNMLESGDWLRPMLHPEVEHWAKPPLTYWSIAASVAVFGRNEFAARLPARSRSRATVLADGAARPAFRAGATVAAGADLRDVRVPAAGGQSRHHRHAADLMGDAAGGRVRRALVGGDARTRDVRDFCFGSPRALRS